MRAMSAVQRLGWALGCGMAGLTLGVEAASLQTTVATAINRNPEVQASWHAFMAASAEQDVARGGFLPRIDLSAGVGYELQHTPDLSDSDFGRQGASLTLSQMIYDGWATRQEVERLQYARLVRYRELRDTADRVALEAATAYAEVLRQRDLVRLAESNHAEHRRIYDQLRERVGSGFARGVDLDQALGRLSLAESNLRTEILNLQGVETRFLRIVGQVPEPALEPLAVGQLALPASLRDALLKAYRDNQGFQAAMEAVQAAMADRKIRDSAFQPRLDLRARQDLVYNDAGIDGLHRDTLVELVVSYNLYSGGADKARLREYAERESVALEQRNLACHNLRQELTNAWQDARLIGQQLSALRAHEEAIGRVRKAAQQQFNIGQRTLLDLLDTENEFFQASRARVIGEYDQQLATLRIARQLGDLPQVLGVSRQNLPTPDAVGAGEGQGDPAQVCAPIAPADYDWQAAAIASPATSASTSGRVASVSPAGSPLAPAYTHSNVIAFAPGQTQPDDLSRQWLQSLAQQVATDASVRRVRIESLAEPGGAAFGRARADAVASVLEQAGVRRERMAVSTVAPTDAAAGAAAQRGVRVTLVRD